MKPQVLTRIAVGSAAAVAVLAPLTGCGSGEDGRNGASAPPTSSPSSSSAPPSANPSSDAPSPDAPSGTDYADGAYTAKGYYGGAPSYMTFTVTLEDGVITDVSSELIASKASCVLEARRSQRVGVPSG
ncbi:MAG: hypothetical protein L0H84_15725 [Pseudonocardia sp.]|nr:hypothetical protein [Pseudonocardia sp.]